MPHMTPGQICRARREELDLSRARLAHRAGISDSTVARFELRDRVPGGRVLVQIARALGISVEQMFPDDERDGAKVA